jgi:NAD(P)-dependent dehydrogenase (short-subunit alcohol dehydrogenase family)
MYGFDGKVAIVTGASRRRGIGCAIALRLAREGAWVVVSDRPIDPDRVPPWDVADSWRGLASAVDEIEAAGGRGLAVEADLTRSGDVETLVEETVARFGRVDFLVNNHSFFDAEDDQTLRRRSVVETPEEVFDAYVSVNLRGTYLTCRAAARRMVARGDGGRIVNIASTSAKRPSAGGGVYGVTKAGIVNLTEVLAIELGEHRITANAVCPGPTATWRSTGQALQNEVLGGRTEEEAVARVYGAERGINALRRPGTPEDQARVVAFLCSDEAGFITGQAINVCGGYAIGS